MRQENNNQPKVSVVVVNWNTCDMLEKCIQSVYSETRGDLLEVIVIDNASMDNSCEMVRSKFPQVKLISNETNVGFARANNQGFKIAWGEYVLMLNSDTIVLDRAIEKTLSFADQNANIAIVGCKLVCSNGDFQNSCFRFPSLWGVFLNAIYLSQVFRKSPILNWDRYGCQEWLSPRQVDCIMGSFVLIRRSVLNEVGYLDTDFFMYGEETDLCYRAMKNGMENYYYPEAKIIHFQGGSQKDWSDRAWSYGATQRGVLLFFCKWRHKVVSYLANIIMTVFMIPRIFVWLVLDVSTCVRHARAFRMERLLKAKLFSFLLKAVFWPELLYEKWSKA